MPAIQTIPTPGDILLDLDEESILFHKHGKILGVVINVETDLFIPPDITARFWIDEDTERWLTGSVTTSSFVARGFSDQTYACEMGKFLIDNSLRAAAAKIQEDIEMTLEANRLYPNKWRGIRSLPRPFGSYKTCMVEGCGKPVCRRIMVNIWGTIIQTDVCPEDALKWHGKCADSFPDRKLNADEK